jgi:hypothetical protein
MGDETGDDGWSYTVSPSLDTWTQALGPLTRVLTRYEESDSHVM